MNSVSWFIYVAQVSNSLGMLFITLGVLGVIVAVIYCIAATASSSLEVDQFKPQGPKARYLAIIFALFVIGNILPEKNTLYAIAASQVGEQIVKSEIATDATRALQKWIKDQIDPPAKK